MKKIIYALIAVACFSNAYAENVVINDSKVLSKINFAGGQFTVQFHACGVYYPNRSNVKACWTSDSSDLAQSPNPAVIQISNGQMPNVAITMRFTGIGQTFKHGNPAIIDANGRCTLHGPYTNEPNIYVTLSPSSEGKGKDIYKISCAQGE